MILNDTIDYGLDRIYDKLEGKRTGANLVRFLHYSFRTAVGSVRRQQLRRTEMARDFAKDFYNSPAWKDCRRSYAASKGNLCEVCLSKGLVKPGEIVHHKIHLNPDNIHDPNVALNWNNLQLVCRDCHSLIHRPGRRYKIDEWGRVISL